MKILKWFLESNRWKHLAGGFIIGLFSDDFYCASYASACVGGAMEFKDYQWGGKPDWVDFALTVAGGLIGYGLRFLVLKGFKNI